MLSALRRLFGAAPRGGPMLPVPGGRVTVGGRWRLVWGFDLDERPVNNREFLAFVTATRRERPPWMFKPAFSDPDQPVVGVTHDEARAYARWANKRLPSDAEWLRAAGAHPFPWGHATADRSRAWFALGERGAPSAAGPERDAGRGPYGHKDLLGNVWEWTGRGRCRGGFWGSRTLSTEQILDTDPNQRSAGIGFRCAR